MLNDCIETIVFHIDVSKSEHKTMNEMNVGSHDTCLESLLRNPDISFRGTFNRTVWNGIGKKFLSTRREIIFLAALEEQTITFRENVHIPTSNLS